MQEKKLHIIAFDNPEPPVYGGVIDVFYRIRTLFKEGVKINLHIWEYNDKKEVGKLKEWCEEIHFYPRNTGFSAHLSLKPYIVQSRISERLMGNLLGDDIPILFEGIHSCGVLSDSRLSNRKKLVRIHNIEHFYYSHLFKNENNLLTKAFFLVESIKLKLFENQLSSADYLFGISGSDTEYLKEVFPKEKVIHLPGFHPNEGLSCVSGKGEYILYHGNLEVSENIKAAHFLIENVFSKIDKPVIIAGRNPNQSLYKAIKGLKNIRIVPNPTHQEMESLVKEAQLHLLYTFQDTGLKLKLLNTLFQGRHLLVNTKMLKGTSLEEACSIANDAEALIARIKELFGLEFTIDDIKRREAILGERYSNLLNVGRLIEVL